MTIAPDIAAIAFLLAFLAGPTDAGVVVREVEAAAAPSPGACAPVMERIAAARRACAGPRRPRTQCTVRDDLNPAQRTDSSVRHGTALAVQDSRACTDDKYVMRRAPCTYRAPRDHECGARWRSRPRWRATSPPFNEVDPSS